MGFIRLLWHAEKHVAVKNKSCQKKYAYNNYIVYPKLRLYVSQNRVLR